MRREINIRKRKKYISNKISQKNLKILYISISLLILSVLIYYSFFQNLFIKNKLEKDSMIFSELNENIPFSIKKILLFSSATADNDSINQNLTLNISQYSDIAIYLNNDNNIDRIISSLYIDNIIINSPEIGTPCLYKKTITDLGKSSFNTENVINDSFYFNVINTDKDINYDNYEIYNNTTTPISLGFFNKNIKTNFFPDNNEILYNGTLLKQALIPLSSLNCSISFRLNIITDNNEHYICNITLDIPFEDEKGSIYNTGYITKELNSNDLNKFIRIK